jgi:hypothetical protein
MKHTAMLGCVLVLAGCAAMRAEDPGTSYQDGINEAVRGRTVETSPAASTGSRCTEVAGHRRSDGTWVKAHTRCH